MPGQVLSVGQQTIAAAEPLRDVKRRIGTFPYQWMFPGPDSQHVLESGGVVMPGTAGGSFQLVTYTVPSGLRFSLRGILLFASSDNWVQGSGDITFTLQVVGVGARPVDGFAGVTSNFGNQAQPWPILGKLEFQAGDTLVATVNQVNTTHAGFALGRLCGHTYPNFEAGDN